MRLPPCHVAVLTPAGRGAVATVVVEGENPTGIVARHFKPARSGQLLRSFECLSIIYGKWQREDGTQEDLIVVRRNQRQIEIHCHGGTAVVEAVVSALIASGCQRIDAAHWMAQQESDPLAAAARNALAQATTERAAGVLLDQYRGALRDELLEVSASIQAGGYGNACDQLDLLLRHADLGLHLTRPWRVVICGKPNVGKSSLINAILGYSRVIVFDQPGTTRDVVTASAAIDGWAVELADTAGLRDSVDPIEATGVARARQRSAEADLVILVTECGANWTDAEAESVKVAPKSLIVYNKSDLAEGPRKDDQPDGLVTSTATGAGIADLIESIAFALVPSVPASGAPVPFTNQQVAGIESIKSSVDRRHADSALQAAANLLRQTSDN